MNPIMIMHESQRRYHSVHELTTSLPCRDASHSTFLFQGDEQVIANSRNHAQRWNEVMEKSDHSVTLIDLCGEMRKLSAVNKDYFIIPRFRLNFRWALLRCMLLV